MGLNSDLTVLVEFSIVWVDDRFEAFQWIDSDLVYIRDSEEVQGRIYGSVRSNSSLIPNRST